MNQHMCVKESSELTAGKKNIFSRMSKAATDHSVILTTVRRANSAAATHIKEPRSFFLSKNDSGPFLRFYGDLKGSL